MSCIHFFEIPGLRLISPNFPIEGDDNKMIGIKRTKNREKGNFPLVPLMKSEINVRNSK